MELILGIDTALEKASVLLSTREKVLAARTNENQKDHGSWVHTAISEILSETQVTLAELAAIAVAGGPGSYTGVRVGMATAKGLCFANSLPLINLNTLELLARAGLRASGGLSKNDQSCICPMIDARRMEVFTAIYGLNLEEIWTPRSLILSENSLMEFLETRKVLFLGSGVGKFKLICRSENAFFPELNGYGSQEILQAAHSAYEAGNFADLAYAEPLYLKEFYSPQSS